MERQEELVCDLSHGAISRSRHYFKLNISEMAKDTAIVARECEGNRKLLNHL